MPYQSSRADSIARLMMEQGRGASDAAYRRGAQGGQLIANIGQLAAGSLRDLAQYQLEAPERARRARLLEREERQFADEDADRAKRGAISDAVRLTADPTTGRVDTKRAAKEITLIDPAEGMKWWQQASAEDKAQADRDHERATKLATTAGAVLGLPAEQRPSAWGVARNGLLKDWDPADIPETYDETWVTTKFNEAKTIAQQIEALKPPTPKTRTMTSTKPDGTKVEEIVEDVIGTTRESAPAPDKPPTVGSFEDYLTTWARDTAKRPVATLTAAQKRQAKADWESAGRQPDKPAQTDDPELPRGVVDYIDALRRKRNAAGEPYTFEDAQQDLAETWPDLRRDHPRVDVVKADGALRSLFRPAPGSGSDSFMELAAALAGGRPAAPAAAPARPAAAAPARPAVAKPAAAAAAPAGFQVTPNANGTVSVTAPDGTRATFKSAADAAAAMADVQTAAAAR